MSNKDYFTNDKENSTSKAILIDLLRSCDRLIVKIDRDHRSTSAKRFLNEIKESTNMYLQNSDKTGDFLENERRPYLFELIRHEKTDLIKDKRFSSVYVNGLEEVINEMGFSYGTSFTKEDIEKIIMIRRYMFDDNINVKLSLEDDEIYKENRSGKRR